MKNKILKNVKLIVYDFDGVMTDNKVILREDGLESVVVNRSDGLAVKVIKNKGIEQVIITAETNKVVEVRAKKIGIPIIKGIQNKKETLLKYCREKNVPLKKVAYIGNDLNDLEAMKCVGYPVCPSDAYPEVKKVAKFVLPVPGGQGVVRDFLRYLRK